MSKVNDIIDNYDKYRTSGSIRGNYDDFELTYDMPSAVREKKSMFNFISNEDFNLSGIESEAFKNRIAKTENEELMNRLYISNNYRGFGYQKNIQDFEDTMKSILLASLESSANTDEKKKEIMDRLQVELTSCFKDKTKTNEEVLKQIETKINNIKNDYKINLSTRVIENVGILISRYRLSVFNIKNASIASEGIKSLEDNQQRAVSRAVENIDKLNKLIEKNSEHITMADVLMNQKGNQKLDDSFKENIISKVIDDNQTKDMAKDLLMLIEKSIHSTEKNAQKISKLDKNDRLASIALNYFLAEKNLLEVNAVKNKNKIELGEIFSSLNTSIDNSVYSKNSEKEKARKLKLIDKITSKDDKNKKRLENYIDRVSSKLSEDSKLNYGMSKKEIENAIEECRNMLISYANVDNIDKNKKNLTEDEQVAIKINEVVKNKIDKAIISNKYKNLDADILETIIVPMKDNLANKILSKQQEDYKNLVIKDLKKGSFDFNYHKDKSILATEKLEEILDRIEPGKDNYMEEIKSISGLQNSEDIYKVDVVKHLEENNYGYMDKKTEDLLASDNLQKIFQLIAEKKLSTDEALTLVRNNRQILKGFSSDELDSVETLIEDISIVKKNEALERRKTSHNSKYLFDNMDKDYDERLEVADYMKREGVIKDILNDRNRNYGLAKKIGKSIGNFFASSDMIYGLAHCASKQVETRKMDTQLSMASQCIDNYKQKADSHIKALEDSMEKSLANPSFAMSGFSFLLVLVTIGQKTKLHQDKINIYNNELIISDIIKHIDSVNDQKIKDALSILYKLDNQFDKKSLEISNVIDKELFMDAKKTIFYAELLKDAEKNIVLKNKDGNIFKNQIIKLSDIIHKEDNALYNIKNILDTEDEYLIGDIEESLVKQKEEILKTKQGKGIIQEEEFQKEQETRIGNIERTISQNLKDYNKIIKENLPELAKDIDNMKSALDEADMSNIKDNKTKDALMKLSLEIKNSKLQLEDMRENLSRSRSKVASLQKELFLMNPYIDLLGENGKIDTRKLAHEIKENPDKVIVALFNQKDVRSGERIELSSELKKKLIFHISDRAAASNNYNSSDSEYFNEIISKVIPHERNLIENISEYDFKSSPHSDDNKINLKVSKKELNKEGLIKGLEQKMFGNNDISEKIKDKIDKGVGEVFKTLKEANQIAPFV